MLSIDTHIHLCYKVVLKLDTQNLDVFQLKITHGTVVPCTYLFFFLT